MPSEELFAQAIRLHQSGDLTQAELLYRQILQLDPNNTDALHLLGLIAHACGNNEVAIALIGQAIALNPFVAVYHANLGAVLQLYGRIEESLASSREALGLDPQQAPAHNNLGRAFCFLGNFQEAAENYDRALNIRPDYASARWNRSLLRLLQGDFANAWRDFECRFERGGRFRCHEDKPRWDGADLSGKTILLYAEQGHGDTIQFVRYAPQVKQRGGTVLLECQPSLEQLLNGVVGVDGLVPQGREPPPFDVQLPLMSLPGIFGTTLATIPAAIPYLRADAERAAHWRKELTCFDGYKVGIVWQGSATHRDDRYRSVPLDLFVSLAEVPGVKILSLQVGPGAEQLGSVGDRFGVIDLGSRFDSTSFADAAAALQCLDLVLTVDTAMAHLGGALGVPVWVILPFVPDWRWLLDRGDSPWYPTLRIFRQPRPGDWPTVFERVATALRVRVTTARCFQ